MKNLKAYFQNEDEKDERILLLNNKISSECYTLLTVILLLYDIYNRFFVNRSTYALIIIFGLAIYKDIRFCIEGCYKNSKNEQVKSKVYSILLIYYFCDFLYKFFNYNKLILILAVVLAIITPFLYSKLLESINENWIRNNEC